MFTLWLLVSLCKDFNLLGAAFLRATFLRTNLYADFSSVIGNIADQPSLSATTVAFYGAIPSSDYWPIVTEYSNQINEYLCDTNNLETNDLSSNNNDAWYYANFNNYSGSNLVRIEKYGFFMGRLFSSILIFIGT
jgi:hypothetical protein